MAVPASVHRLRSAEDLLLLRPLLERSAVDLRATVSRKAASGGAKVSYRTIAQLALPTCAPRSDRWRCGGCCLRVLLATRVGRKCSICDVHSLLKATEHVTELS